MDILGIDLAGFSTLVGPALDILMKVVALASAVAAVTPTPTDDTIVGKLYKVVDWLALNVGKAKDKPLIS